MLVPTWLAKLLNERLGISPLDPKASEFFTSLCHNIIQSVRQGESASSANFIQMVSDKVVTSSDDKVDMKTDTQGRPWTTKGLLIIYMDY